MNVRKLSARTKPCRATAIDIRPRYASAPQGRQEEYRTLTPFGNLGKAKQVEMTSNDLRAFGHALLVEAAPAPNAALINIMKQAKAWS